MSHFDLKDVRDALWRELKSLANLDIDPFPSARFGEVLQRLESVDRFWTFPGREVLLRLHWYLQQGLFAPIVHLVNNCSRELEGGCYRRQPFIPFQTNLERLDRPTLHEGTQLQAPSVGAIKPYFEVLVVHPCPAEYEMMYRQQLASFKSSQDEFIYDIVFVGCAEDALTAVLANADIQACVYLNHTPAATHTSTPLFSAHGQALLANTPPLALHDSVEINLCRTIQAGRPGLDHYLISEHTPAELPHATRQLFNRVLFHVHPFHDLHAALLDGVRNRYSTPFFDALQAYSREPKGVFHALPLSRGASVKSSAWIIDMLEFYGDNIFLAETSSTQGGLDSLLDPTGAIKQAHVKAAETFGADQTFFVTNGTSTSNKIVLQANLRPGDIVLMSADCHKSIPYGVMLAGAHPIILDAYPLPAYDIYGGVSLAQIKTVMLELKRQGLLGRLKQITLTSSTFDGLLYHCENFMLEILAIKPDIIFHWDEAWSAFAHFHPLYYSRTAMSAARNIRQRLLNPEYRLFYAQWSVEFAADPDEGKWQRKLYPDPSLVQLRVYSTQSTHKTLTSFRQGSMIHVADTLFNPSRFIEAFRMHTSTSPNYQIVASLDIARRQAALEGFHRVRGALFLALQLRRRIQSSSLLRPYFRVLDDDELIPAQYREHTGAASAPVSLSALSARWGRAGFVIDPTHITLDISGTGLDGPGFRQLLMTRYDIQVNKTSRNTVLLLITIGATQATIDYLVQVLSEMAALFAAEQHASDTRQALKAAVLPEARVFHRAFLPFGAMRNSPLDLRTAHADGNDEAHTEHAPLSAGTMLQVESGRTLVSATFVTPYPPGFPVLVPGQIITAEILTFFQNLKIPEIHGLNPEHGFRIFRQDWLNARLSTTDQAAHTGTSIST